MNINYFLANILLIATLLCSVTNTMEEKTELSLKELPAELHVAITQFLGNNVLETLQNIKRLSFTDAYFNNLVKEHLPAIAKSIKNRFKQEVIGNEFKQIIRANDLNLIKLFDEFALLDKESRKKYISEALDDLLAESNMDRIKELFIAKIISRNQPSGKWDLKYGATPISRFLMYRNDAAVRAQDPDKMIKITDLLKFLVDRGFIS